MNKTETKSTVLLQHHLMAHCLAKRLEGVRCQIFRRGMAAPELGQQGAGGLVVVPTPRRQLAAINMRLFEREEMVRQIGDRGPRVVLWWRRATSQQIVFHPQPCVQRGEPQRVR